MRRVGEVECLGAEDHAKPFGERECPAHAEAGVDESRSAKRVNPRRSEAAYGEIGGRATRPRQSLFGYGRVLKIGGIEIGMVGVVTAKNHVRLGEHVCELRAAGSTGTK